MTPLESAWFSLCEAHGWACDPRQATPEAILHGVTVLRRELDRLLHDTGRGSKQVVGVHYQSERTHDRPPGSQRP